jgi:hypothetical protein
VRDGEFERVLALAAMSGPSAHDGAKISGSRTAVIRKT